MSTKFRTKFAAEDRIIRAIRIAASVEADTDVAAVMGDIATKLAQRWAFGRRSPMADLTHGFHNACSPGLAVAQKLAEAARKNREAEAGFFFHVSPKPDACAHDFRGWRAFSDGNGGEQVCAKCGMGAMAHSLRVGL